MCEGFVYNVTLIPIQFEISWENPY